MSNSLRNIASLIGADLPTRVYFASLGGFDTHQGQAGNHQWLECDSTAVLHGTFKNLSFI